MYYIARTNRGTTDALAAFGLGRRGGCGDGCCEAEEFWIDCYRGLKPTAKCMTPLRGSMSEGVGGCGGWSAALPGFLLLAQSISQGCTLRLSQHPPAELGTARRYEGRSWWNSYLATDDHAHCAVAYQPDASAKPGSRTLRGGRLQTRSRNWRIKIFGRRGLTPKKRR